MKKLLFLLLFPVVCSAQTSFNAMDSVVQFKTGNERIGAGVESLVVGCSYMDMKKKVFQGGDHTFFQVNFRFVTDRVTSITPYTSKIQIMFTDNKVKEYTFTGNFQIFGTNDYIVMYLSTSDTADPIFTVPIKQVRFRTSSAVYDYNIKEKKQSTVIDQLQLMIKRIPK